VKRRIPTLLALCALAALPVVADRLRTGRDACPTDGAAVDPAFRVRVIDGEGAARAFCGVRCAAAWLARHPTAARRVLVTDCATGREIDGGAAFYVKTFGPVPEGAPDGIRVFEAEQAALEHARAHGGKVLDGAMRPFGPPRGEDDANDQ
jgi:hypothetical protein